ncbi:MAG: hypothetical protein GY841_16220 [FCB group bacterium]|nr:hypothetical protein [FCB group bacterium]
MKLIEALKKVKDLDRKAEELRVMVSKHCAISSLETPQYENQGAKVISWLQAHSDVLKEILRLRIAIQRTNLATEVTVMFGDEAVTKTIAEWVHRRRDLAGKEFAMWDGVGDRNIREGFVEGPGGTQIEIKVRRFYDAETRDVRQSLYSEEPSLIDGKLEIANAVTDLIE